MNQNILELTKSERKILKAANRPTKRSFKPILLCSFILGIIGAIGLVIAGIGDLISGSSFATKNIYLGLILFGYFVAMFGYFSFRNQALSLIKKLQSGSNVM